MARESSANQIEATANARLKLGGSLQEVFILSAVRTPIGKFGGSLASMTAADMGMVAARAAMERAGVQADQITETIFGNARQAGGGPNVARQISIRSGVPKEVPAYTVNMACASGMKSIALAHQEISNGNLECVLAGGTESMSRLPYYLDGARWGYRLGHQELVDGMHRDGFFCPMAKMVMGETAEVLAEQYKISREEQDQFALCSQQRAERAIHAGRFDAEIAPVTIESKKQHKLKPLARIMAVTSAGVDPRTMGIGPVPAIRSMEQRYGLKLADFELIELNEAFAAQVLACDRELHMDHAKLNVNGGAISLGHPIGCTGTRITTTLLHEMIKRKAKRGLATLCVSGGMGMALAIVNLA
jgi:acetyl-CoA C-acetyltransferase